MTQRGAATTDVWAQGNLFVHSTRTSKSAEVSILNTSHTWSHHTETEHKQREATKEIAAGCHLFPFKNLLTIYTMKLTSLFIHDSLLNFFLRVSIQLILIKSCLFVYPALPSKNMHSLPELVIHYDHKTIHDTCNTLHSEFVIYIFYTMHENWMSLWSLNY